MSVHEQSEEIDLRDIAIALYEGWKWIAASIVTAVVIGLLYVYAIVTPHYSTEISYTSSPGGMNVINSMPGTSYTEAQAVEEFSQRLSSYENFRAFYDENPDAITPYLNPDVAVDTALRDFFFGNISVSMPSERDDTTPREISLLYTSQVAGADLLNSYFKWSESEYIDVLIGRSHRAVGSIISRNNALMDAHLKAQQEAIETRIAVLRETDEISIAELEDRLEAQRQAIVSSHEERIRVLENAEQIAARLGIEKPTTPRDLGRQTHDREVIYAEINSQGGLPLYFMGVEALRAEREILAENINQEVKSGEIREIESQLHQLKHNRSIEALMAREDLSPFTEEYNKLRAENEILAANMVAKDEVSVASIIHWAYPSDRPNTPGKAMVLALSLVLGGMLGVFLVFMSRFVASVKGYRSSGL